MASVGGCWRHTAFHGVPAYSHLRAAMKKATIPHMDNDKLTPETEPEITPETDPDEAVVDEELLANEEIVDEIAVPEAEDTNDAHSELGIDAALAAVASLSDVLSFETEPEPDVQTAEFTAVDVTPPAPIQQPQQRFFSTPPPSTLSRGSMSSVVPALVLIGIGAWLTFALSTGTPPQPLLVAAVVLGGIALTLLSRWLSAGRWARGTLFMVSAMLLSALVLGAIALTGTLQFYPLLFVALGIAFWISAQFARPRDLRLMFPGSVLVIGGLAGLLISSNVLGADFTNIAANVWFIPVIVLVIVWLLPLVRRGR
jgi:hypothetical protein